MIKISVLDHVLFERNSQYTEKCRVTFLRKNDVELRFLKIVSFITLLGLVRFSSNFYRRYKPKSSVIDKKFSPYHVLPKRNLHYTGKCTVTFSRKDVE